MQALANCLLIAILKLVDVIISAVQQERDTGCPISGSDHQIRRFVTRVTGQIVGFK
jgi:hypothetical protein